jgi:hypothetical protein
VNNDNFEEEKIALPEGPALLYLPRGLSLASVEDLQAWLLGALRRAHRRASLPGQPPELEEKKP